MQEKRINARLSPELAEKMSYIQEITLLGISDILKNSINLYYESLCEKENKAFEVFESLKLIGCAKGSKNYSENYKKHLKNWTKKYDNR